MTYPEVDPTIKQKFDSSMLQETVQAKAALFGNFHGQKKTLFQQPLV